MVRTIQTVTRHRQLSCHTAAPLVQQRRTMVTATLLVLLLLFVCVSHPLVRPLMLRRQAWSSEANEIKGVSALTDGGTGGYSSPSTNVPCRPPFACWSLRPRGRFAPPVRGARSSERRWRKPLPKPGLPPAA